jgi:hypothetical protein
MYTWKKNSYNSKKFCSPQIFECKVLDHGSTKQTHAALSVTVPEEDGGIRCGTSLNKHYVAASGESNYLLPFVRKVPDRHYPLTAIPPFSPISITSQALSRTFIKSLITLQYTNSCTVGSLAPTVSGSVKFMCSVFETAILLWISFFLWKSAWGSPALALLVWFGPTRFWLFPVNSHVAGHSINQ